MNDNIWSLLQIKPTTDQVQIKRAYASRSKLFHPEEDPEGFLRLRQAYSLALEWAEDAEDQRELSDEDEKPQISRDGSPVGQGRARSRREEKLQELHLDREELQSGELDPDREEPQEEEFSRDVYEPLFVFGQESGGANPYRDSDVYRAFLAVYRKENQKNWKLWMEYFTSPDFLSVSHEEEFCALIEETVREKGPEFCPGPEFVKGLYTAYCFTAVNTGEYGEDQYIFRQEQNRFAVPDPIFAIVGRCPIPRKMTGNDQIMRAAFSNYYYLRSLKEDRNWTDGNLRGLRQVLERYVIAYIKDNYTWDGRTECARHPLGLRLLNYFFDTAELTGECYLIAWETLNLKQAVMGRNKLFYGRLREICLKRCPELEEEDTAGFFAVNKDFNEYVENAWSDPQQEEQDVAEFFGREDVKRALRSRRYVEKNVLTYWISLHRSRVFLRYLQAFYEADRTAPCAREVLQAILGVEESRRIYEQNEEDRVAPASAELVSVKYRPFLRYFFNTAFRSFRDLNLYLMGQLPCLIEWAERLQGLEKDREAAPVSRRVKLDGMEIEVLMHLYYVEYRLDGREIFRPFLSYEKAAALDTEELLLLLPVVIPEGDKEKPYVQNAGLSPESRKLEEELRQRLAETALPQGNQAKIAENIANELTRRFLDFSQAERMGFSPPLKIYRETHEALYCAEWSPAERRMSLYMDQGQGVLLLHSSEIYDTVENDIRAEELGKELLRQLISPASVDCSCIKRLPETVYVSEPSAPVRILESKDITIQALNELLERFAKGELRRLEFSFAPCPWELKAEEVESYPRKRSIVFLRQETGEYICLYFDDIRYLFYALKKNSAKYVSLSHQSLSQQYIFAAFDPIWCNLEQILTAVSEPGLFQKRENVPMPNGCSWQAAWGGVFIQNRRVKYNLAKQELGKFPLERAWNSEKQPFVLDQSPEELNRRPLELEQRRTDKTVTITQIDGRKKPLFSEAMKQFFQGEVVWLRLSWEVSLDEYRKHFAPEYFEKILARRMGESTQNHIVLRRDGDLYTLLCLQDLTEEAEYYVADRGTYMDVEGKKYPKGSFLGRTMPAYLIHRDPVPLRNQLDLLLDHRKCLVPIMRRFAQFAPEKSVKKRGYDAIRKEVLSVEGMVTG